VFQFAQQLLSEKFLILRSIQQNTIMNIHIHGKYPLFSLGASSLLCYAQLRTGWVTSKHNCLVSYLLCWWHVSVTVAWRWPTV